MYDEFEEVIRRHREADAAAKKAEEENERFTTLESKLDTLVDTVTKLASSAAPRSPEEPGGDAGGAPASSGGETVVAPPAESHEEELPVERVTRLGVPKIYTGDDEPEIVRYIEPETGETKTRKGRRKGHPAPYEVESVEMTSTNETTTTTTTEGGAAS